MALFDNAEQQKIQSIKNAVGDYKKPLTLADIATKSGVSLMETKTLLNTLIYEYRGNLSATSLGELLYTFPHGFSKPWEIKEKSEIFWAKVKNTALGFLKFVVRAWITIVMVGYVVIFALILLALSFSKSDDRDDRPSFGSSIMMHMLLRMIFDSLFWTFHPFSPFYYRRDDYYDQRRAKPSVPFYERVNRYFFGPEEKSETIEDKTRVVMQEIRALKGRVGIFDVMRVTGMSKEEIDPFMAGLLAKYEGDIEVTEEGAIYFVFPSIRKTTLMSSDRPMPAVWNRIVEIPPFTGNPVGSNMLITFLNGFNLVMSTVALANGWTVDKLRYLFMLGQVKGHAELLPPAPEPGVPLILGVIPFVFSLALFTIPVLRALGRPKKIKEVKAKNGKRGLIRAILSKLKPSGIKEAELIAGWEAQAQSKPTERELSREIIRLGGEIETKDGFVAYRFPELETLTVALDRARKNAGAFETRTGDIIFSATETQGRS